VLGLCMFHDLALRCVRPTTEPAQAEVVKYLQLAAPADLEPTMYPGMYPQIGVDVHSIRPGACGRHLGTAKSFGYRCTLGSSG